MKHRKSILLFVVAFAAVGCGSSEGEGKPTSQSTPDEIQRDPAIPPGAKDAARQAVGQKGG